MADGGAGRCLSDLPDDLLRHILFLAPDREGASTAVLSRRWRRLWSTSGAVLIDSRSFNGGCSSPDQECESILSSAEKALAAAAAAVHGPVRRLTFFIAVDREKKLMRQDDNLIEALVSNPAARCVEELKIVLDIRFTLCFGSLPSEALRVLRLIGHFELTAPPLGAAVFPMLVELHLQDCDVSLVDFRKIIRAAPRLSTLHLKSTSLRVEKDVIEDEDEYDDYNDDDDKDDEVYTIDDDDQLCGRLLLPAVTALVVADCYYGYQARLEMDVPRLQYFSYKGQVQLTNLLSLKSQASSNMIQVDLDLTSDRYGYIKDSTKTRTMFRQFIQNFNTTKLLMLKLDFTTDHLALEDDKASQDELLGGLSFYSLDQLEVEAKYNPEFERPLLMMLSNLLHSCPIVRDLRLKLKQHEVSWVESSIDKDAGLHFDRSVNGFRNRRRRMVSLDGEDDDNYYQAFSIVPCLTGEHSFSCLQSHLKRVSLHFFKDEPNCLGVQLSKFFAENAMVLHEIHIDDGCHEMQEHVNPTVRRWIAKTDKVSKQVNVKD